MTPKEFLEWSFDLRENGCKVVENHTETPDTLAVWSKEQIEIPDSVNVENHVTADGTAPAVKEYDVEGWNKYTLTLQAS